MQMRYITRSVCASMAATVIGLCLLALAGCNTQPKQSFSETLKREDPERWARYQREEALRKSQETPWVAVGMSCFIHGKVPYIQGVFVEEYPTGQGSPGMKGGNFNCGGYNTVGYRLPEQWRPGMKVKVRWRREDGEKDLWVERYTTIRYYERVGTIYVHFFPNDQVRVVAANSGARSPYHPLSEFLVEPPPEIE